MLPVHYPVKEIREVENVAPGVEREHVEEIISEVNKEAICIERKQVWQESDLLKQQKH